MLTLGTVLFLIAAGVVAGFIDAIAGGGGLITLPALATVIGPGVIAIGSNKIVGGMAALVALLVYMSRGHLDWGRSLAFTLWVALGSLAGSRVAPLIPPAWFPLFLAATCPLILWIVWKKDLWVAREASAHPKRRSPWDAALVGSGLACGFYDGLWGPGGGTFMFLSLFFFAKLPLMVAIAGTKLANTASAFTSLASYALQGHVRWLEGGVLAVGVSIGGFMGARHANKQAARVVRPVLLVVVSLLIVKLLAEWRR
ncbi:MAG TPA: TSUP family transporter [Bdellovibrionota bacterium]|nr:TSUP family transporter [Bdellovibrionota bacterium]